jgi:hypothetical protein
MGGCEERTMYDQIEESRVCDVLACVIRVG